MRSCATDLIHLCSMLLILLGGCVMTFAQDYPCTLPNVTVTCEVGQQAFCKPIGDSKWVAECKTISSSNKTANQSLRERQGAIPQKINSSYSATARFLASSPYGSQMFYCWPIGSLDGRDWRKEEVKWRNKVQEEPNKLYNHVYLARSLLNNNKLVEAENEFRSILQLVPPSAVSWGEVLSASIGLGVTLFEQGKYAEAEAAFQRFMELQGDFLRRLEGSNKGMVTIPHDSCSLYMLALAQAAQQNYKEAEATIRKSGFLPDTPSSYTFLGSLPNVRLF
jgi:tetratricopeptide (TPR) repeat protein